MLDKIDAFVNGNKHNVVLVPRDDPEGVRKEFERGMKVWTRRDLGAVLVYSDNRRRLTAWLDYENCVGYKA